MTFATRSQAGSLAPASPTGMALMHQAKHHIEKAVQELELKMKVEFVLITKEQIVLGEHVKRTTDGFADALIALKNKIEHLEKSCETSRSEPEITEGLANDKGTLRHDDNQPMEARDEIETKADLRFSRVAGRLGRVEAQWLLCQGILSFSIAELVPRGLKRPGRLLFHNTIMMSQSQVRNIVRIPRQSMNQIVQAFRKKALIDGARRNPSEKSRSKGSKALSSSCPEASRPEGDQTVKQSLYETAVVPLVRVEEDHSLTKLQRDW